ncbi:MAG: DNA-3-methyladenine glycosylase 2 family protein [Betaproteobacteria bacterium]|nr:DNA-3-methyladenine glycosylase 2 family protein [Betaproteobacteria bacterium]
MGPLDWSTACRILAARDTVMRQILENVGDSQLRSRGEPFTCLARSIVGQQISVKAADTVWTRLCGLMAHPMSEALSPRQVLQQGTRLREAGLSAKKVDYLMSLSHWFAQNPQIDEQLQVMTDAQVIALLTQRPGIGPWTAQMFLIFTLMRPDVFPVDDLGVLKAVEWLYPEALLEIDTDVSMGRRKKRALAFSERWAPHRTVATWLLWRSLDPVPVEY